MPSVMAAHQGFARRAPGFTDRDTLGGTGAGDRGQIRAAGRRHVLDRGRGAVGGRGDRSHELIGGQFRGADRHAHGGGPAGDGMAAEGGWLWGPDHLVHDGDGNGTRIRGRGGRRIAQRLAGGGVGADDAEEVLDAGDDLRRPGHAVGDGDDDGAAGR